MGKRELERFTELIDALRNPGGCPWDRKQTHRSLLPYLIDEAYEYLEAVEEDDPEKMEEELGDLLLQIGLHARIGKEADAFTLESIARTINEKLIRRHPHVFGTEVCRDAGQVSEAWEQIKSGEKGKTDRQSLMDGVPPRLPALFRAEKIQRRAARAGFDWNEAGPVLDKVEEEFGEFRRALEEGNTDHAEEELGDILFSLVNLARHHDIHAEGALRKTTEKFMRRFKFIERRLEEANRSFGESNLEELDRYWNESKTADPT